MDSYPDNQGMDFNNAIVTCVQSHLRGRCGRDHMIVGFTTTFVVHVQSVPITTKVVSSNSVHGEVYMIQHYVIKFVSDL